MARPRKLPDETILAATLVILRSEGINAVTFAALSAHVGLAASSLAQRFGTRDALLHEALALDFDRLDAVTADAIDTAGSGGQGALRLLLNIGGESSDPGDLAVLREHMTRPELQERRGLWRARIEAALAARLGPPGTEDRQAAAMLFALWQGALLWDGVGGSGRMRKFIRTSVTRLAASSG